MKRTLAFIVAVLMVFALFAACGEKTKKEETPKDGNKASDVSTLTRYPSETGQNNWVNTEQVLIPALDKNAVHPSADATFKFGAPAAVTSLCNYTNLGTGYGTIWTSIFYDTLVLYDRNKAEVVPCLATSWEWIDDYTLRFHLREDVKSHLGDPFTASDVVFSLKWGCDNPKLLSQMGSVYDLEKTKVVDKYTVDIGYLTVTPYTLLDLGKSGAVPMVVEASAKTLGDKAGALDPSMGTGPYKLKEWDQVSQVIYAERNEDYWGALPYYKYYNVYTVVDTTTRCMGVEAGDYDVAMLASSSAVINAMDNPDIATYSVSGGATIRMDINSDREPLNIKEIRQAIALGINYDAIIQVAYSGYATRSDGPLPPAMMYHKPHEEGSEEFYQYYDPERAKEKLKEAGYPNGFDLPIMFTSGLAPVSAAVEIIQNNLRDVGINVTLEPQESASYNARRNDGDFWVYVGDAPGGVPISPVRQADPRRNNWTGHQWLADDEEGIYALIDRCYTSVDPADAQAAFEEYQDMARELIPNIALAHPEMGYMMKGDQVNLAFDVADGMYACFVFPAEYITG